MKESYEAMEMEVIAFDGEVWTATNDPTTVVDNSSGRRT